MRFFNTAGPVNCEKHYCLPPLSRFNLPEILTLISQEKYFVLHAPRQSGKTSCLLACAEYFNKDGRYYALYTNVEAGQAAREDVTLAMRAILYGMLQRMEIQFPNRISSGELEQIILDNGPFGAMTTFFTDCLTDWINHLS